MVSKLIWWYLQLKKFIQQNVQENIWVFEIKSSHESFLIIKYLFMSFMWNPSKLIGK